MARVLSPVRARLCTLAATLDLGLPFHPPHDVEKASISVVVCNTVFIPPDRFPASPTCFLEVSKPSLARRPAFQGQARLRHTLSHQPLPSCL